MKARDCMPAHVPIRVFRPRSPKWIRLGPRDYVSLRVSFSPRSGTHFADLAGGKKGQEGTLPGGGTKEHRPGFRTRLPRLGAWSGERPRRMRRPPPIHADWCVYIT